MRKINKSQTLIVKKKLVYPNNKIRIIKQLISEQSGYCAYTEVKFKSFDARDIEHFNPNLKNTNKDGYSNWYAVLHRWNQIKSTKWDNYQPCYIPYSNKITKKYRYDKPTGLYVYNVRNIKADNLAKLIGLNHGELPNDRKAYITRVEFLSTQFDLADYFRDYPDDIQFRTAIETVFGFCP